MRNKIIVILFAILCLSCAIFAQTSNIDSLEIELKKYPEPDTLRINLLIDIARQNRSIDLKKSIEYSIQADSLSRLLNYNKGIYVSLHLLGNCYFYTQDFSKAIAYYKEALVLCKESNDKDAISYNYNFTGNVYFAQGDYSKALQYYQKALEVFQETDDKIGVSGMYNNIGNIYYTQSDYPRTLEYFHKALKVFEDINNETGISGSYNNIGIVYDEQGDYSKALEYYQKALTIREKMDDTYGISDSYMNIGNIYNYQGDYAEALEFYQKSLKINEELDNKYGISINYYNIGVVYLSQDDYKKSLDYYQKSIKIAGEIGAQDMITLSNIELCKVYFKLRDYNLAIQYGEKGYKSAFESGERQNVKTASDILSQCYAELENYKKAYQYHVEFKTQSDSILNESNIKEITNLENQYEFEKEKEIISAEQAKKDAIQEEELKRQKVMRNSFIAGFFIVVFFAIIIFLNLAQKRKANRKLAEQKAKIEKQASDLKKAHEKLLELDQLKQNLTSMIVHDLKNPLNGIINVSQSYSAENQVRQMKQIGKQMLNMVLNILDVNKYEDTKMTVDKIPVSLLGIAQKAVNSVLFLTEQKNITIVNKIKPTIKVYADSEIIERVFLNLLTNAIKYTPNNRNITISAKKEKKQDMIKVSVTDSGSGIPSDKIDLVFVKFRQVAEKKSGGVRSTGLGLTFCKMAVEAHNGKINVESELDKGSTFWFTLPSAQDERIYEVESNLITTPQEKYQLTSKDKKTLTPYIEKLEKIEIYKMMELRKILKQISSESENIMKWKNEIMQAIRSGNKKRYKELLKR